MRGKTAVSQIYARIGGGLASEVLFRSGIAGDLMMHLCNVPLAPPSSRETRHSFVCANAAPVTPNPRPSFCLRFGVTGLMLFNSRRKHA
jgi:hypothetical protein